MGWRWTGPLPLQSPRHILTYSEHLEWRRTLHDFFVDLKLKLSDWLSKVLFKYHEEDEIRRGDYVHKKLRTIEVEVSAEYTDGQYDSYISQQSSHMSKTKVPS